MTKQWQPHPDFIQSDPLGARAYLAAVRMIKGETLSECDWEALHDQSGIMLREIDNNGVTP